MHTASRNTASANSKYHFSMATVNNVLDTLPHRPPGRPVAHADSQNLIISGNSIRVQSFRKIWGHLRLLPLIDSRQGLGLG